jgi:hypothetical protein
MADPTLLDVAKLTGSDQIVGLIEQNLTAAPEVARMPVKTIKGTSYKIVMRTGYPSVGFRSANAGVARGKSEYDSKLAECFILDAQIRCDKAVAQAHEDGVAGYQMREASGVMAQALIEIGSQIIYGTSVDSSGFPGLTEIHTALNNGIVLDAGGTTASTGSSVWGLKLGDQGVQLVFGNNSLIELGDWQEQQVDGPVASTSYTAFVNGLTAWVGLQVGSKYSIGRLKDATADSGKGVTDARLSELLSLYPIAYRPDVWLMNRRSAFQLQSSRSSTVNATGSKSGTGVEVWAPLPTESCGIPIIVTDSIGSTETLT